MSDVLYKFAELPLQNFDHYIFQLVENRRLTNIYHAHDFYEIVCFLNGNGKQRINSVEWTCAQNSIAFLCPGDKHAFSENSKDVTVLSVSIQKEEFEAFAELYDPALPSTIRAANCPVFTSPLVASILQPYIRQRAPHFTKYDCKYILSCLLNAYILSDTYPQQKPNTSYTLSHALNEMKKAENLREGIPAFVRISHFSQSHLSRLIKARFGITLKTYINELRLQEAYKQIIISRDPMEEIAENVGFSSFSHFNKIFKEQFSTTPSRLRKEKGIWTT